MENYKIDNLIKTNLLPVIPLRGKVAFPDTAISFEVGRPTTLKAVNRASATTDKLVLICTQKITEKDEIDENDVAWYFTAVDFETGETVYRVFTGLGRNWNNSYGPITIGPNGNAYIGVFNGLVCVSDYVE